MWHCWIEGAAKSRINLKIPIGTTEKTRRESRALAERAYFALMAARASDRFGLPRARQPRTFAQQRAWYQENLTALKKGQKQEVSMLGTLGEFFDAYELHRISVASVREWRAHRTLANAKASTVRREEALLRHLLSTAVPDYLASNPLEGFARVKVAPTDTRLLSQDEERRLVDACATAEDRALIIGALDTLLRLSNIAMLSRTADHGSYLFADTKVGGVRIPISTRLRKILNALPQTGPHYFPSYATKVNRSFQVFKMFTATCARAGLESGRRTGGLSFHSLRHTGATRMLAAGVDVKTVMLIGGWQNLHVLERYLHPSTAAAQAAVETIAG